MFIHSYIFIEPVLLDCVPRIIPGALLQQVISCIVCTQINLSVIRSFLLTWLAVTEESFVYCCSKWINLHANYFQVTDTCENGKKRGVEGWRSRKGVILISERKTSLMRVLGMECKEDVSLFPLCILYQFSCFTLGRLYTLAQPGRMGRWHFHDLNKIEPPADFFADMLLVRQLTSVWCVAPNGNEVEEFKVSQYLENCMNERTVRQHSSLCILQDCVNIPTSSHLLWDQLLDPNPSSTSFLLPIWTDLLVWWPWPLKAQIYVAE